MKINVLKNNRIQYFISILIVIFIGLISRKIEGVPVFFGDTLYAIMIYFGLRLFFINFNIIKTAILALFICFAIEFFQLYDATWLVEIRSTTLGHYVLGQGFLWSDLGYYTLGITIAYWIDFVTINRKINLDFGR